MSDFHDQSPSCATKMEPSPKVLRRLTDIVRSHNNEVLFDVVVKASLGIVFTVFVYGLLFWIFWFFGFFIAGNLGLAAWQFSAILVALFLVVGTWSAWRRVDPLADLDPMTDQQKLHTIISQASPDILYFSPRHATAGAAIVLIGGPANVIEAIGMWTHHIPATNSLIDDSARLLASCQKDFPVEQIRKPAAALLLLRMKLIKIARDSDSAALALTQKGRAVLFGQQSAKR